MGTAISLADAAFTVTVTVLANLRHDSPSREAAIVRKLPPGEVLNAIGIAAGEEVKGNALWYQVAPQDFVWSGACSRTGDAAGTPTPSIADASAIAAAIKPARAPSAAGIPPVIDLYHGDVVTSFADARTAGVRGIIHKATTGASGRDDLYHERRRAATDAGLLWGAYHWGTAAPAAQQVDNFLKWAAPDEGTLVALDLERTNGNQMTLERAREFLSGIEDRLGRKAVLYSGNLIKEFLGDADDPFFGAHRLWLAQYGSVAKVQRSWAASGWWLWQYAEKVANIPGLPGNAAGELDLDRFGGTDEELAAQWAA